jgi:hypothetical protein
MTCTRRKRDGPPAIPSEVAKPQSLISSRPQLIRWRWRLLLSRSPMCPPPLSHCLFLLRRQDGLDLFVRSSMDLLNFLLPLVGAQRRVVFHIFELRLDVFVDFLHLRFRVLFMDIRLLEVNFRLSSLYGTPPSAECRVRCAATVTPEISATRVSLFFDRRRAGGSQRRQAQLQQQGLTPPSFPFSASQRVSTLLLAASQLSIAAAASAAGAASALSTMSSKPFHAVETWSRVAGSPPGRDSPNNPKSSSR